MQCNQCKKIDFSNRNSSKETIFFANPFLLSVTFQNVLHLLCTWVKNQPKNTKKNEQKLSPKHFENATATSSSKGVLKHLKKETIPLQPSIVGAE